MSELPIWRRRFRRSSAGHHSAAWTQLMEQLRTAGVVTSEQAGDILAANVADLDAVDHELVTLGRAWCADLALGGDLVPADETDVWTLPPREEHR